MIRKYLITGMLAFVAIIAWNVFLVQRDDAMFKEYSRHQAIENLKNHPSNRIK